jgi:hypothetical protein
MFKKMVMFAASVASRGLKNKKTDTQTKQLRVLSCFGNEDIPPCPFLKKSQTKDKHFCGKCGCGDNFNTWLLQNDEKYSKLDYPVLNCPIKMPGFSNYDPNFYEIQSKDRKKQIEDCDPSKLELIQITIGKDDKKEKIMSEAIKIIDNS